MAEHPYTRNRATIYIPASLVDSIRRAGRAMRGADTSLSAELRPELERLARQWDPERRVPAAAKERTR